MIENDIQTIARDILADDDYMGDLKTFARECIRLKGERDVYKELLDRAMTLLDPNAVGVFVDRQLKLAEDIEALDNPSNFDDLKLHVGQRVRCTAKKSTYEGEITKIEPNYVYVKAPGQFVQFDRVSWDKFVEVEDLGDDNWTVIQFNANTCWGTVSNNLRALDFHSTSFHGDDWPQVGEEVEVVFNTAGELLSVHGK